MDRKLPKTETRSIDKNSSSEKGYFSEQAKRKEEMERAGHKISIILLKVVMAILVTIGFFRVLHLVVPHGWQWLSPEELFRIDEFFIHGTIGALVSEFLRGKISTAQD